MTIEKGTPNAAFEREPSALDVVPPARIARLVEDVGLRKVHMAFGQQFTLAVLAGAFIAFGALFYTVTVTGSEIGFGPTRLLGGVAFSLGLVLVIIGGAELFTGNSLIVLAWTEGRIATGDLLRNWAIVYCGNFVGALVIVGLVHVSGVMQTANGDVAKTAGAIAAGKAALPLHVAFVRAILCNILVCLAVWMCFAAHTVAGKVLAIVFPISAFVAIGLEHSVANMYFIPIGMLQGGIAVGLSDLLANLLAVTLGNVIGGGGVVALVYWFVYIRAH